MGRVGPCPAPSFNILVFYRYKNIFLFSGVLHTLVGAKI
jgi:hypothetical protein